MKVIVSIGWSVEKIQAFLLGVRDNVKNTSIYKPPNISILLLL